MVKKVLISLFVLILIIVCATVAVSADDDQPDADEYVYTPYASTRSETVFSIAGFAHADFSVEKIDWLYENVGFFDDFSYDIIPGYVNSGIYVLWARDMGIIYGVGDNKFLPDQEITREAWAAMWVRYLINVEDAHFDIADTPDYEGYEGVSEWARPYVYIALEQRLLGELGDPQGPIYQEDRDGIIGVLWDFVSRRR